jgi:hypothetical protein
MKLSAPTQPVWLIAIILGIVGILGHYLPIAAVAPNSFILVSVAFVLLALACMVKGL